MTTLSWIHRLFSRTPSTLRKQGSRAASKARCHLGVEALETRLAPAVLVNTLVDETADTSTLSMREAIGVINNPSLFTSLSAAEQLAFSAGQPLPGSTETITFDPSLFTGGPGTITLDSGIIGDNAFGPSSLGINGTSPVNITIQGPDGSNGLTIAEPVVNPMRIFTVAAGNTLTLENLTLTGGRALGGVGGGGWQRGGGGGGAAGLGGAILNAGTLVLDQTTLTNNRARGGDGVGRDVGSGLGSGGGGGGLGAAGGLGGWINGGAGGGPSGGIAGSGPQFFGDDSDAGGSGGIGGGGGGGGSGFNAPSVAAAGGDGGFGGGGGGGGAYRSGGQGGGAGGAGGDGGFGGGGGGSGGGTPDGLPGMGGFGGGAGITSSTNSGNIGGAGGGGAGLGGAVFNLGGTLTITNSTLSANSAEGGLGATIFFSEFAGNGQGLGGAVFNRNGTVTILNSTLSLNTAADGGRDVFNLSDGPDNTGTAHIANSILGQSGAIGATDFDSASHDSGNAPVNTGATNLMSNPGNYPASGLVAATDPMLGALTDNGGPTQTMALLSGSLAIDAGTAAGAPNTDQRGVSRAGIVDIGAFEFMAPVVPPTVASPTAASVTATTATLSGNVTSEGDAPVTTRGVVYALTSDNSNPTIGGSGVTQLDADTAGIGVFTVGVTGLTPGSGYSFAAFATNNVGTTYSPVGSFTTTTVAPGDLSGTLENQTFVNYDLTAEGTLDWAVWGTGSSTSLAPDVSKASGSGISDLTSISNGNPLRGLGQFGAFAHSFQWSDGDPTASAVDVSGGIQHDGNGAGNSTVGEGFSFTVPADTTARILHVYATTNAGDSQLTATLSDGSAVHLDLDVTGAGSNEPDRYTIQYAAGSAAQTLTVTLTLTADASGNHSGNVAIHAVTLATVPSNEAPSMDLANTTTTLPEDTNTTSAVKVADILVSDDALGSNMLSLSGADAGLFEIIGAELYLKAGTTLDFETNPSLDVTVSVDDDTVGSAPDDSSALTISVTKANPAPTVAAPPAQTAFEDVDKAITGITVGDPQGDNLTVTLNVGHGSLTLGTTTGLNVAGNGSGAVSLSGSIANLNAALASLRYRGTLNYSGADTLSINASDGSQSTSGSVAITVKSAAQLRAELLAQIDALYAARVLTQRQAKALTGKLKLNDLQASIRKLQGFLTRVNDLREGTLTQAQADSLWASGNILLLSMSKG